MAERREVSTVHGGALLHRGNDDTPEVCAVFYRVAAMMFLWHREANIYDAFYTPVHWCIIPFFSVPKNASRVGRTKSSQLDRVQFLPIPDCSCAFYHTFRRHRQ
jgi:hypothetical protein